MNERCKDALYHSWGKAPERKKLEREYNRNYYNKNKHKWGVKNVTRYETNTTVPNPVKPTEGVWAYANGNYPDYFIGPRPKKDEEPKPNAGDYALTAVGAVAMMAPGGAYLFESPQQYANYIKEDISSAKIFMRKVANVGYDVARASKKAIASGKKFLDNLNVVKKLKNFIKEGQQYMDEYY